MNQSVQHAEYEDANDWVKMRVYECGDNNEFEHRYSVIAWVFISAVQIGAGIFAGWLIWS